MMLMVKLGAALGRLRRDDEEGPPTGDGAPMKPGRGIVAGGDGCEYGVVSTDDEDDDGIHEEDDTLELEEVALDEEKANLAEADPIMAAGEEEGGPTGFCPERVGDAWRVAGHAETAPMLFEDDGGRPPPVYFPHLADKYGRSDDGRCRPRVISVCVPCYNEERSDLDRTIESLCVQILPPGCTLEVAIVMDGMAELSASMRSALFEILGDAAGADGGDDDEEATVVSEARLFDGDTETVIAETAGVSDTDISFSLVLKRRNHGKVNSQMWWLGPHSASSVSEFVFATDCGVCFEPTTLQKLVHRLDSNNHLSGVTGFQRVMTSETQGDGSWEMFNDPFGCVLRQIQMFDFESDQTLSKQAFDSIGFMPVLPGPCGLYRADRLGNLKEDGVASQYFSLVGEESNRGIVLGNVTLAEDRIKAAILVFQQNTEVRPTTGFVHDAVFYSEAEKPLESFVAQRRRWLNGTFAAYLWVVRDGLVSRGEQPFFVKLAAYAFIGMNLVAGVIVRLAGHAAIAALCYNSIAVIPACVSATSADELRFMLQNEIGYGDGTQIEAIAFTALHLGVYAIFMIAHTPRAVPIKDKSGSYGGKLWRSDRSSAYRPILFGLSFLLSALQGVLLFSMSVTIFVRLGGWQGVPDIFRVFVILLVMPYAIALFDGVLSSKRPNIHSLLRMIRATPVLLVTGIWFFVWLPSHAAARFSDLSWGNRESSSEETTAEMAIRRAKTGRIITFVLVFSNISLTCVFITLIYTLNALEYVLLPPMIMSLCFYLVAALDMIFRQIKGIIPKELQHYIVTVLTRLQVLLCPLMRTRRSQSCDDGIIYQKIEGCPGI